MALQNNNKPSNKSDFKKADVFINFTATASSPNVEGQFDLPTHNQSLKLYADEDIISRSIYHKLLQDPNADITITFKVNSVRLAKQPISDTDADIPF
jgi:hypothetical protein